VQILPASDCKQLQQQQQLLQQLIHGTDLLSNVIMQAEAGNNTQRKYCQLLTAMCEERQQTFVELFHIVLPTTNNSYTERHYYYYYYYYNKTLTLLPQMGVLSVDNVTGRITAKLINDGPG